MRSGKPFIIPVFIPHLGCPHRCVFCDQRTIAGGDYGDMSPIRIAWDIERFLSYKKTERGRTEIAFYGGNFLGLKKDYRRTLLDMAQTFVDAGRVDGIRFSTRPDTIHAAAIDGLASYGITTIEVGVQSLDDHVLAASRRGHTAEDSHRAVETLQAWGGDIGLQIMPGLPGDTAASITETGYGVAAMGPDFVRIYPTVVIRGTPLERWYRSGRFRPLSLEDAVNVTKTLYVRFKRQAISVIRMGLHGNSDLLRPGNIVAGPYHPAFGHLVHSALFLDSIVRRLEAQTNRPERLGLRVNPRDVSRAIGANRKNVRILEDRFGLKAKVFSDPGIIPGCVEIMGR